MSLPSPKLNKTTNSKWFSWSSCSFSHQISSFKAINKDHTQRVHAQRSVIMALTFDTLYKKQSRQQLPWTLWEHRCWLLRCFWCRNARGPVHATSTSTLHSNRCLDPSPTLIWLMHLASDSPTLLPNTATGRTAESGRWCRQSLSLPLHWLHVTDNMMIHLIETLA